MLSFSCIDSNFQVDCISPEINLIDLLDEEKLCIMVLGCNAIFFFQLIVFFLLPAIIFPFIF